jgi:hypothetical protein
MPRNEACRRLTKYCGLKSPNVSEHRESLGRLKNMLKALWRQYISRWLCLRLT